MERVRIYGANNEGAPRGVGLFAKALMEANPAAGGGRWPPVRPHPAGELRAAGLRLPRLAAALRPGITASALIRFHSRYKYLVLSHATTHYRALGRLLANLGKANLQEVADSYIQG